MGPAGEAGANGSLRIYGDGSAGAATISGDTTLTDPNLQYTDFTVNNGVTLTVASGTILRVSGVFTNNGIVAVNPGTAGGVIAATNGAAQAAVVEEADPGEAVEPAKIGLWAGVGTLAPGGLGGFGIGPTTARTLLSPGHRGGGSGAGSEMAQGGNGGGTLVVLARGGIVNQGGALIRADGTNGGQGAGGGAGGIIVLASSASINNTGTLSARGGDGGPAGPAPGGSTGIAAAGAGGGGGGGIVHRISPSLSGTGTVNVAQGAGGATASGLATSRLGGAGGGACGGSGGTGGDVDATNNATAPMASGTSAGLRMGPTAGHNLTSTEDPTSLF